MLFLLTALITGQLAAGQRRRARQAERREREAVVLYDVVRLVGDPDLKGALNAVAERLRRELDLLAVAIEVIDDGDTTVRIVVGDAEAVRTMSSMPTELLSEGEAPSRERRAAPGRWVRVVPPHIPGAARRAGHGDVHVVPVKSQGQRAGTILLAHPLDAPEFESADDRLLSAVAAQLGLAIERRRLRREATEAEALRRTDELRAALLNAVSHDLRTPLASIMASAGSLLQKDVPWTEEERDQFAAAIERESGRLNRIVGNLLDLSRIQKELPPVPLDYVEIDQVLSNLVENAVKYSPPGTEIQISAQRHGEEIWIEVADCGPGIPVEAMPLLFKPYRRLEGEEPRPKSTGLGLAVARGLVEAHGGRIWAENRRDGGAKFIFTLPLSPHNRTAMAQQEQTV